MTYLGVRGRDGRCHVRIHDEAADTDYGPLPLRNDLANHCPYFDWGLMVTQQTDQLALALLAHHLGDDGRAIDLHHDFRRAVVARLPLESWSLTAERIGAEIAAIEADRRGDIAF